MDFGNGVRVDFDKKDGGNRWPDVTPARLGQGDPIHDLDGDQHRRPVVPRRAVSSYWSGLGAQRRTCVAVRLQLVPYSAAVSGTAQNQQPANGEQVGFFVTAGDARAKDVRGVTERSNVVSMPFPSGGGYFTFSSAFRRK